MAVKHHQIERANTVVGSALGQDYSTTTYAPTRIRDGND